MTKHTVTDAMIDAATNAHHFASVQYLKSQGDFENNPLSEWSDLEVRQLKHIMGYALKAALEVMEKDDLSLFDGFPPELPLLDAEQPTDTQDNDGWIKWNGGKFPNGKYIEVKYNDEYRGSFDTWTKYDIIAYRIIDEPKAEELNRHRVFHFDGNTSVKIEPEKKEPKKQTLLQFIEERQAKVGQKLDSTYGWLIGEVSQYLEEQNK